MPVLTRAEILELSSVARTVVPVALPHDQGTVHVRTMTGAERMRCEALMSDKSNPRAFAALPLFCLCDGDGQLLFAEDEIDALMGLSATFLHVVARAAAEANKLEDAQIRDAAKNS